MDYAIAHATKGTTFVVYMDGNKVKLLRYRDDPMKAPGSKLSSKDKVNLLEMIKPGDRVFTELGGAADRLTLALIAYGADVQRYPSFLLGSDVCYPLAKDLLNKEVDIEKPHAGETSEKLTDRKARAYALLALSRDDLARFMPIEPRDLSLLQLKILYRAYERAYKGVMRSYQGLLSAYRDQVFIDLAFQKQRTAGPLDTEIKNAILEKILADILGGEISDTERTDFFAMIGKEFEDQGGTIPDRASEEDISKIVMALIESDQFRSTVFQRLKEQKRSVELLLQGGRRKLPGGKTEAVPANDVYKTVFEPIPGVGPLIAARLISAIGDIRRFPTNGKLRAYAGYHNFPDGTRARRVAGKVSNWNTALKQGVYLWCDGTVKLKSSPWRVLLDRRKAYELFKLLRTRELLPAEYQDRIVTGTAQMKVEDLTALASHVDGLRKQAGVTSDAEVDEDGEELNTVKDAELAKKVRGLKMMAHQKGMRWLGQQFLDHIHSTWRKALGLSAKASPLDYIGFEEAAIAREKLEEPRFSVYEPLAAAMRAGTQISVKLKKSKRDAEGEMVVEDRLVTVMRFGEVMVGTRPLVGVEVFDEVKKELRFFRLDRIQVI